MAEQRPASLSTSWSPALSSIPPYSSPRVFGRGEVVFRDTPLPLPLRSEGLVGHPDAKFFPASLQKGPAAPENASDGRNGDAPFEADRREVSESGMPAMKVVPALEKFEDGHPGFCLRAESAPVEQLALERRKEALAQSVVVAVPHRSHRGTHPRLPTVLPEGDRGVLPSLIGVMDDLPRPPLPEAISRASSTSWVRR